MSTPLTSAADRKQIIELAAKNRLPAIYEAKDWAENGGLISYGADRVDIYRRAAMLGLTIPQSILLSADKVIE